MKTIETTVDKLLRDYVGCVCSANSTGINAAISGGERDIPGLRIWQESQTRVRT